VKKVDVEIVDAQAAERRIAGGGGAALRRVGGQDLLTNEEVVSPAGAQHLGDQLLRLAVPVELGGVDVGEPDRDQAQRGRILFFRSRGLPICQVPCPTTGTSSLIHPEAAVHL